MFKIFAAAATAATLAAGGAFADGSHSHSHSHPHDGHGSYGLHHSHDEKIDGAHTHEIDGITLTHEHRRVKGHSAKAAFRERLARNRFQKGAGFGPYSLAEYRARAAAGQPGIARIQEPWPLRRYRNQ